MMETRPRILIVDDNPMNVQVLTDTLSEYPYEILVAMTGERAVTVAARAKPDIILLDINLPGINGYEACKRLKTDPTTEAIPVIFLSALNDPQSKIEGFEVGGVDHISKPFNRGEVIARLDTHLKIAQLTATLKINNQELLSTQAKLENTNRLLLDSIIYAERIQSAVFKTEAELRELLPHSFILFSPQKYISGDFYWFHQRRNKLFVVVGDCTGHGVPGALLSILATQLFIRVVEERGVMEPADALEEVNFEIKRILKQESGRSSILDGVQDGMDVVAISLDQNTLHLKYACANRHLLHSRGSTLQKLIGDKHPIGGCQQENQRFTSHTLDLQTNDTLFLMTDGFCDQFGGDKNRKFQTSQFLQLLESIREMPIQEQAIQIRQALFNWKGNNEQTDDILIVGIQI